MTWQVITKVNHKRCSFYNLGGCRNDEVDTRLCDKYICPLIVDEDEKISDIIDRIYMEGIESKYKEAIESLKEETRG